MKKTRYIHFDELEVPIEMIPERRRSARAAFGKNAILLRFPRQSSPGEIERHFHWVEDWLHNLFKKKPKVFERYRPVKYFSGKNIITPYKEYSIQLKKADRKTLGGRIQKNSLEIKVPRYVEVSHPEIGSLVSRMLAKDQLNWIESKVEDLNDQYFREEIKKVSLRNASTRWGSCSHTGNISLSTRILLAPERIIEHIIIHELAHLKELNHSPAFWKWVRKAEPDHDNNDRWLKKYGYQLKF